ncbi:hypothetical protein GALMADRAFT_148047 [Galerina marginata CBS 339.88]|uniref:Uncharacterized protein n=1 Tax=Galerina marginata (strain CBS 339.88) TaxID=685588 RepID=A0A067S631_GALM3|nr:hypothetical protein GALMADRAFT_148047 [Galerina marginata CBS 339.88]
MTSMLDQAKATLPFDIIGSILDQVAYAGDTKTLCVCSFISSDVLHLCRTHIFRTFDMRTKIASQEESILINYYYLLSVNPQLVRYVRHVHVLDLNPSHWVLNHPFLPRLLHLLTNLEIFGLHIMKSVSWKRFDFALQSSITELVARPSLVGLFLTGIEDVHPSVFNICSCLQSLNLISTSLEPPSNPDDREKESDKMELISSADGRRIYLEAVSFRNCQVFLTQLKEYMDTFKLSLDFSRLRDLNINFSPTTFDLTWKIIHSARTTLETLKISQSYTEESDYHAQAHAFMLSSRMDYHRQLLPNITLAPMQHLRELSFTIQISDLFEPSPRETLSEWCLLLKTAPRGLKNVHIILDLFFLYSGDVVGLFPVGKTRKSSKSRHEKPTLLSELDEALSSDQFFPSLSSIVLEVQLPEHHDNSSDSEYAGSYAYGDDPGPPPPSLTLEEVSASVRRMMKLTRNRLDNRGPFGVEGFTTLVGIGG